MFKKKQDEKQFEKDAKKEHKNARASHGKDSFFTKNSLSRQNKRQDLIEDSLEDSGISKSSLKGNVI